MKTFWGCCPPNSFSIAPDPLLRDQTVHVDASIRNAGTADSGIFWIEFWGSRDQVYPGLDFPVAPSVRVDNLAPGATFALTDCSPNAFSWLPPGSHAIGCFVDRLDQVGETNEVDNYRFLKNRMIAP